MTKNKPVILGLGNPLFSDEGVGIHLVQGLMWEEISERAEIVDGGTDALYLLGTIEGTDHLLVVDAIDGDGAPGSLYRLEGEQIDTGWKNRLSAHQIGFQEVLGLARLQGRLPAQIVLLGVQPQSLDWGTELTDTVAGVLPRLRAMVYEQIASWDLSSCPTQHSIGMVDATL